MKVRNLDSALSSSPCENRQQPETVISWVYGEGRTNSLSVGGKDRYPGYVASATEKVALPSHRAGGARLGMAALFNFGCARFDRHEISYAMDLDLYKSWIPLVS